MIRRWLAVVLVLVAGLFLGWWKLRPYWSPHLLGRLTHYTIFITSAETTQAVDGAKVTLRSPSQSQSSISDSKGVAQFDSPHSGDLIPVDLHVEAEGFEFLDLSLRFPPQDYLYKISLKPLGKPVGSMVLKERQPYTRIVTSGPVPSGVGNSFSQWYRVVSEPPLPGYMIDGETKFSLSGDRNCGGWSVCRLVENGPDRVVFEFNLQGHSEWPFRGPAYSVATLQVTYKPIPIHILAHIRGEQNAELKGLIDKLKTFPYFDVTVTPDYAGDGTRLEYYPARTSEEEAKRVREAICETVGQPYGWLPIRAKSGDGTNYYYDLSIKDSPK